MSANGIWKSRYEHESGYGDTFWSHGVVNIVDGRVYLDSTSLEQCLEALEGQVVAFEFVMGLDRLKGYGKHDDKISPLVKALKAIGVRTLNSCEGHMEERYNYLIRYPYVDFHASDQKKVKRYIKSKKSPWTLTVPFGDPNVLRLRTIEEAADEASLTTLQNEAIKLAEAVGQR